MSYDREAARFWGAARKTRGNPSRTEAHWQARLDLVALKCAARHPAIRQRAAALLAGLSVEPKPINRISANQAPSRQ